MSDLEAIILDLWVALGTGQAYLGRELVDRVAEALDGVPETAAIDFVGVLSEARARRKERERSTDESPRVD